MSYYNGDTNFALRLIEWIELMGIMGSDKIFTYDLHIDNDIKKVIDYYEEKGNKLKERVFRTFC